MFFEYGLIWAWFFFLSARYLRKQVNYRLNRIPLYLMSREYKSGDKRSVLYGLFSTYNLTPGNNVFRGHLHHAQVITMLFDPLSPSLQSIYLYDQLTLSPILTSC